MKMLEAMQATIEFAQEREFNMVHFETEGIDYQHFMSMHERASTGEFSEGKLGRWLGYMQGVLVATEFATLEEMKELNKKFAD